MRFYTFDCFDLETVKEINKKIKKNLLPRIDTKAGAAYDTVKRGDFFHVPTAPLLEIIHPWLYRCQQYNQHNFGYDIYWNFHLDYMNYNEYALNDEYEWHIDALQDEVTPKSDMKLTCLLNLSEEPYEGGEFHGIVIKEPKKFSSGMGLVMNSLMAHKVTPITKGKRTTLTYFATGPSWR